MERPWDDKTKRYKTELAVDADPPHCRLFRLHRLGKGVAEIAIVDPADDIEPQRGLRTSRCSRSRRACARCS